tara:strand:+ start:588 stop:1262 length:675 start_codon:yes stop_codon:yes gene_type:complete
MNQLKDVIHVQKNLDKDFKIVLENTTDTYRKDNYDFIRKNRMYRYYDTMQIQKILTLYKPDKNICIIDYNEYSFYSIMSVVNGYKTFYINKSKKYYNEYIYHSLIINNILPEQLTYLNSRFIINKYVKKYTVALLIINDIMDSLNSKRLINKGKIHNILVIRTYEDNLAIYKQLHLLEYSFYKVGRCLNKIENIEEFLKSDTKTSILCRHPNSILITASIVNFD